MLKNLWYYNRAEIQMVVGNPLEVKFQYLIKKKTTNKQKTPGESNADYFTEQNPALW